MKWIRHLLPENLKQSFYFRFLNKREIHESNHKLFSKAPLRFGHEVQMFDLVPGDIISGNIAFNGFYELELTKEMVELAKNGGTLCDIGANMGYFSLLWASLNPNNKVISFEASPRVGKLIEKNIQLNSLESQITLHKLAAGKTKGVIPFTLGDDTQTGWGGMTKNSDESTVNVEVVRPDEILDSETSIDVLKIDIEGADTWALMGCESLLRKKLIKKIFFEENLVRMKELGINEGEAKSFLENLGYSVKQLGSHTGVLKEWVATPN